MSRPVPVRKRACATERFLISEFRRSDNREIAGSHRAPTASRTSALTPSEWRLRFSRHSLSPVPPETAHPGVHEEVV